ncbi:MAG: hypothetical protein ACFFFD_15940 [Promethearchaeota archaeon]
MSTLHSSLNLKSASDNQVPGAIWSHTYGGPLGDACFDVIEVSTGGFAMAGYKDMNWTVDMGKLWIVRTDEDGTQLWNRTYTSNWSWGQSILECSDGGFLVAGKLVTDEPRIWLVRTDANGNHLWNRTYGGVQPAVGPVVSEMVECAEGGFAIFGSGPDSDSGDSDYYLVRIDDDGTVLWNYTYNDGWMDSPADRRGLVQCSDGGFAMLGYRRDYAWQSPYSDVWLVRTDPDGNHLWNMTYGGPEAEFPNNILTVDSDIVILFGVAVAGGEERIIRVDDQGNVVLNQKLKNNYGLCLTKCSNGGYAVAGVRVDIQNEGEYTQDGYLARIDDDFNYIWEQTYNCSHEDVALGIVECSAGGFAMAGAADGDFWLLRVADQAPASPIGLIAVGIGVTVAFIAVVAILRVKRR